MRPAALEFLACPTCHCPLSLEEATATAEDGHVTEGRLRCHDRGCRFPIRRGVPFLLPGEVDTVARTTAARFDEQWTRWRDIVDARYEKQFLEWIAPVTAEAFTGQLVFEGGCGKGRHSALSARFGARAHVAVDLGESALVAFENTRALPAVHIVIGDLRRPPVKPIFDLAFSVGVLHHLPDPAEGFTALSGVVRTGGRVVCWVYGIENNEWIVRFVDPVRTTVTARLPPEALRALSALPSAALWMLINHGYRALPASVRDRLPYHDYFASLAGFGFKEIHNIVFDQLVTPVAHYLPGDEVRRWFAQGFSDVTVTWKGQYSWTGTGVVTR